MQIQKENDTEVWCEGWGQNVSMLNLFNMLISSRLGLKWQSAQEVFFTNLDAIVTKDGISCGDMEIDGRNRVMQNILFASQIFSFPARLADVLFICTLKVLGGDGLKEGNRAFNARL